MPGSLAVDLRWALLALRRTLPPGLALALAAWLGLVLAFPPAADSAALAAADGAALVRGLQRAHAWSSLLGVAVPALFVLALRHVGPSRRREREWLASTPLARPRIVLATWLGTGLAAAAVVTAAALAIEIAVGASGPARRVIGRLDAATFAVPDDPRSFSIPTGAEPATHVRFDLRALGPGSAVVELGVAGRPAGARRFELGTHRALALELPPEPGPRTVTIRRIDRPAAEDGRDPDVAFVVPAGGIELVRAEADDRIVAAEVAVRALVALLAWSGLALGLGTWLSVPLAFLSITALQVAAALADAPLRGWPGIELWAAIARVGRGELPPPLELASIAAALGLAAAGLVLALIGRGDGGRA